VSKSIWVIVILAAITALMLSLGMMISLGQFQELPEAEWVKLGEAVTAEFKLEKVGVRVGLHESPTAMHLNYLTRADSKFNSSVQNAEMERIAAFAAKTYTGRDLYLIEKVKVIRSETHGSGCFQQTYVATFTYTNPNRTPPPSRRMGGPSFPPRNP
jgi:hypothetical protein